MERPKAGKDETKMKKLFSLFAALCLALTFACGAAEGTGNPPVRYSEDLIQYYTFTEGTPYYDYICFTYNNPDDVFEDYTVTCAYADLSSPLTFEADEGRITVVPGIMCSYETVIPYIEVDCIGEYDLPVTGLFLDVGSMTLELDWDEDSDFLTEGDNGVGAYAVNLGSNLYSLLRALSENAGAAKIRVTFLDGSETEGSVKAPEENPWKWYYEGLKACGLLDADGNVQEDLRLVSVRFAMGYQDDPAYAITGADVIDDLQVSIAAQPLKLEYPESLAETVPEKSFIFGVLNYSNTFVKGSGKEITGFDIEWSAMDRYGMAQTLKSGGTVGTVHYDRTVKPGEQFNATVDADLPDGCAYVRCRLTAIQYGNGDVVTIPERDRVAVEYMPGGMLPEDYDF